MGSRQWGHLTERYQLSENVRVTRLLLNSIILHSVITFVIIAVCFYVAHYGQIDDFDSLEQLAVWNEFLQFLASLISPAFLV